MVCRVCVGFTLFALTFGSEDNLDLVQTQLDGPNKWAQTIHREAALLASGSKDRRGLEVHTAREQVLDQQVEMKRLRLEGEGLQAEYDELKQERLEDVTTDKSQLLHDQQAEIQRLHQERSKLQALVLELDGTKLHEQQVQLASLRDENAELEEQLSMINSGPPECIATQVPTSDDPATLQNLLCQIGFDTKLCDKSDMEIIEERKALECGIDAVQTEASALSEVASGRAGVDIRLVSDLNAKTGANMPGLQMGRTRAGH